MCYYAAEAEESRFRRSRKYKTAPSAAITARPPITPPTIAPVDVVLGPGTGTGAEDADVDVEAWVEVGVVGNARSVVDRAKV